MTSAPAENSIPTGGKYDFDDGGTYCGQWDDGKAHGFGVCTGPKGQGEYSGSWHYGYEVSGVYTWPSGTIYEGQWQNGKRHGLGIERRGRWLYRGEWTQGFMGRYGVRSCRNSTARYEGTWMNGLQDGYGIETYADAGAYQGQWFRGMRHGYGVRKSAAFGVAAKMRTKSAVHASLTSIRSEIDDDGSNGDKNKPSDCRGGFALRANSDPPPRRRSLSERSVAVKRTILQGFRIKKQRSTGDLHQRVNQAGETPRSIRSSGSTTSCTSDESGLTHYSQHEQLLGPDQALEANCTETYYGEWKNDRRSGFGVSERSDGLKYEGEWYNNRKYGYGVTTFKDNSKEEGKYKNNVLVLSQRKKNMLFVRASKLRERIDQSVMNATRSAQMSLQKADIAVSRMSTARDRAEQSVIFALQSREDSNFARFEAKRLAPEFRQPGAEILKRLREDIAIADFPPFDGDAFTAPSSSKLPKRAQFIDQNAPPASMSASTIRSHNRSIDQTDQPAAPSLPHPNSFVETQHRSKSLIIPSNGAAALPYGIEPYLFVPESSGATPPMETPPDEIQQIQTTIESPSGPDPRLGGGRMPSVPLQHAVSPAQLADRLASAQQHQPELIPNNVQMPIKPTALPPASQPYVDYPHKYPPSQNPAYNIESSNPSLASESSSRYSLNQMVSDHFDQYGLANHVNRSGQTSNYGNPSNYTPSLAGNSGSPNSTSGAGIVRRSTVGSPDWPGNHSPGEGADLKHRTRPTGLEHLSNRLFERTGSKNSLPDPANLQGTPLMSREQAAHLSHLRREEVIRLHEEQALLRSNPLRYLFHPAIREWFRRRKFLILVVAVNLSMAAVFYQLLSAARKE